MSLQKLVPFWSDNFCIDGDKIWAVDTERNLLYEIDYETGEYELVKEIPDEKLSKFRLNPRCLKCENEIYCMPDESNNIWVYNIDSMHFSKMDLVNPNKVRHIIQSFVRHGDYVYALSKGLSQVIEVNIQDKKIENYYKLADDDIFTDCIVGNNSIIGLSINSNKLYEFNIETKKIFYYSIPNVNMIIKTICYDGENFWLSGNRKKICIWNRNKNSIREIEEFPQGFGLLNFSIDNKKLLDMDFVISDDMIFGFSAVTVQYVWFIPWRANKILYVNRFTYEINSLEIDEEEETIYSITRKVKGKYQLCYVKNNRYIGLYSFKNKCIFEIDAEVLSIKRKSFTISEEAAQDYMHSYLGKDIYFEKGDPIEQEIIRYSLHMRNEQKKSENIGIRIYEELK